GQESIFEVAESSCENCEHLAVDGRNAVDQSRERAGFEHEDLRRLARRHSRGAGLTVEQRHLAEEAAGTQDLDGDAIARDFALPRHEHEELAPEVALPGENLSGGS